MVNFIFVLILLLILHFLVINYLSSRYSFISQKFLWAIAGMHFLLTLTYYLHALSNPSDSHHYYLVIKSLPYGLNWSNYYATSTEFIHFLAFPLVSYFGFSYESCMFFFGFLGFLGFAYFYVLLKEKEIFNNKIYGVSLLSLILLLPNLHFWSASLGKGSVIFLGFGLFFFGLSKLNKRYIPLIIGGLLIYHVRPHIMLIVLISISVGFIFSTKGVGLLYKVVSLAIAVGLLIYIYDDVAALTGLEDESLIEADFSKRAQDLSKATSGINIESYNFIEKLFAFIYRPLFFDAPGVLGIIVSFENAFYLLLSFMFFKISFWKYLFKSEFIIKASFFSFWFSAIALAQISGNLGLAIRQKSQVMVLLLFVLLKYLDEQKLMSFKKILIRKAKEEKLKAS